MKRLGIFACYFGASGKAEEYVFYLLEKMKPLLDSLVVVCNGRLLPESRKRLRQVADAVVCRENAGFDAGKSNPIYGNSDTVQPPAYLVNIWKRTA